MGFGTAARWSSRIGRAAPWRALLVAAITSASLGALGVPAAAQAASTESGVGLLERPARLEIEDALLEAALRALQRSSGVSMAFSADLLPSDQRVGCACADSTVAGALDVLLGGTDLVYREGRRQILIGRRPGTAPAAERTLVGRVVETDGGRPIPAAEVRAVGGPATVTGDDGSFRLRSVPAGSTTLSIRSLGYAPRQVTVPDGETALVVSLERQPIPLDEIVIAPGRFGVLEEVSTLTGLAVSREDIEAIPQVSDDVFRTLKRMPGVASDDISTRLNVRGGSDRDLLVRLDGAELFEPYHLKDLDGALGIVDVQALGGIDLVTGGFPAEYGDKTAGVFEMYSRRPPAEGTRTTLTLSLGTVGAISQGSLSDGRAQWLVSLRRGFLEYMLSVTGVDDEIKPTYWDALGRVSWLVSDAHSVWLETLYGGDELRWFDEETASAIDSRWTNGYAWAGWRAELAARVDLETVLSVGRLTRRRIGDVDNPNGGAFTPLSAEVTDRAAFDVAGLRQDWRFTLTDDLMLKAGVDLSETSGWYDYSNAATRFDVDAQNQLLRRTDSTAVALDVAGAEGGAYAAVRARLGERATWEIGVRRDWQEHTGDDDVAPRVLLRVDLRARTTLRGSWGRYFQSQGLHELDARDGDRLFYDSERAEQVALGVEHRFSGAWSARLEAYDRRIDDPRPEYVNLARAVNPLMEVESDRRLLTPTDARARGVEAILAYDGIGPASGSLSYALAESEQRIDGTWVPRTLDQRHTLNLRGAWRFADGWQLSGVWSYHTGWPFTEQFLEVEPGLSEDGTQQVQILKRGFGALNAERLPAYHRLDVRMTKAFDVGSSRLELFLDVFNVYNRTNLRGFSYWLQERGGVFVTRRDSGEEQLPILPTLGVRWVF